MKSSLSTDAITRICAVLDTIIDDFPVQQFTFDALNGLEDLEIKQRVKYLISVLAAYFPTDFEHTAEILLAVKQHWDWGDENDARSSFAAWPLIDYIAVYGLENPQLSLSVLKELTPLFSAEFAIRPFIEQHFELTHQTLLMWCNDTDEHVRRLASEGIRPRLPWAKQLKQFCDDPAAILPILDLLKDDVSPYVQRSVANNLNDIAKDNADKIIALCQLWAIDATAQRRWIIRHGLRSLVKEGRKEVFPLLGYSSRPQIELSRFQLVESTIHLGGALAFSASLLSKSPITQTLVIDYKIHHKKANGSTTSKVFKWKNITLQAGKWIRLTKSHPFKIITTRKYYSGQHAIELLVNGKIIGKTEFELVL